MKKRMIVSLGVVALALLVGAAGKAGAVPIDTIVNPSFELDDVADFSTGPITGWSKSPSAVNRAGLFDPAGTTAIAGNPFEGPFFNDPDFGPDGVPDGSQTAFTFLGGSLFQILPTTVQAGTYTLSVEVGHRDDGPLPAGEIQLRAANLDSGGNIVSQTNLGTASASPTPGSGLFETASFSTTYVGAPDCFGGTISCIGDNLLISLQWVDSGLADGQIHWDNVRLHFTSAVPEPGTLLLFGTGLVGVGIGTRRRRKES